MPNQDTKVVESEKLGGKFTFPGSSLTVHRVGYGAMQLAGPGVWGPPRSEEDALAVLREAVALGIDHIDTADFYGPHVTNALIAKALRPYPGGLTLVTKVGFERGADKSWQPASSRAQLTQQVRDNLQRLGLDAMEIVNLRCGGPHGPNDAPLDEPLDALIELKRQGLVRHIGLSTVSARQFEHAVKRTEIVCVQNMYNLAHREDDAFIDQLATRGVAYVPYFPLGGFSPLQASELAAAAEALSATPMQVALAWLLQRAPNILLIPGTSSVAHLRENLRATELKLSSDVLRSLGRIGVAKA